MYAEVLITFDIRKVVTKLILIIHFRRAIFLFSSTKIQLPSSSVHVTHEKVISVMKFAVIIDSNQNPGFLAKHFQEL